MTLGRKVKSKTRVYYDDFKETLLTPWALRRHLEDFLQIDDCYTGMEPDSSDANMLEELRTNETG